MKIFEEVYAVLDWLWQHDYGLDYLCISTQDGDIAISVFCSDFFFWGTADAENIEASDLPLLEQTHQDVKAILPHAEHETLSLFAARKRKLRPMDGCYDHIPIQLHELFNAAGPVREMNHFNCPRKSQNENH